MNIKIRFYGAALVATASLVPSTAFGWGQYGHQQVNNAAIDLLGDANGLGACFNQGRYVVKRMAISPDVEWKTDMSLKNLSPADKAKRSNDDQYEHQLHFDEVDAWVPEPKPGDVAQLPGGEYKDVFAFYRQKLVDNADYVKKVDPSKTLKDPANPTVNEVTGHGTAPWRALQLYRLGVEALKKGDVKAAMLYLGTMGHYVGDMSQPFHASLDFDGGYYPRPAAGIHHEIDTGTLPSKGKDANDVYPSFDETAGPVAEAALAALKGSGVDGLSENQIVPEIFKMIDGGTADVPSFLKLYADECALAQGGKVAGDFKAACDTAKGQVCNEEKPAIRKVVRHQIRPGANPTAGNGGHGAAPVLKEGDYCVIKPAAPGEEASARPLPASLEREFGTKVVPEMERRIGSSAALLARMWSAAYEAAGKPTLSGCGDVTFDQSFVIQNYPRPNDEGQHGYMPDGYKPGRN